MRLFLTNNMIRRLLLLFLFTGISYNISAKENWQQGIVVTVSGDTLNGEIDFQDWKRNPDEIRFRQSDFESISIFTPNQIISFEVSGERYISKHVTIDQTPLKANALREVNPESTEATVFLKVLVKADISLYEYKWDRINYYVEYEREVVELISNEYVVFRGGRYLLVETNKNVYLDQLSQMPESCNESEISKVNYSTGSLIEFVAGCNSNEVEFTRKRKRPILKHGPFITGSYVTFNDDVTRFEFIDPVAEDPYFLRWNLDGNFNNSFSFGIGYQVEIILPYDLERNSISIALEYHLYKFTSDISFSTDEGTVDSFVNRFVSDIEVDYRIRDIQFWYTRRATQGLSGMFLEVGVLHSARVYNNTTAGISVNSSDRKEFDFDTPHSFFGLFLGVGLEGSFLYSRLRGRLTGTRSGLNSVSIATGIKF